MNVELSKKWLLLPIALVLLVAWLLFRSVPGPSISAVSYERIQLGMSLEEVKAIIGLPPGHHSNQLTTIGRVIKSSGRSLDSFDQRETPGPVRVDEWWGDQYAIWVVCDGQDKVIGYHLWERPVGWIGRIRARLGL